MALDYKPGLQPQAGVQGTASDPSDAQTPTKRVDHPVFAALSVGADGSIAPAGSQADPLYVSQVSGGNTLGTGTDKSGSITTGGTAQSLASANTSRRTLNGENISAGDLWINEVGGTAAIGGTGSYQIAAGAGFAVNTRQAVSIIGATTGQKFTATETV